MAAAAGSRDSPAADKRAAAHDTRAARNSRLPMIRMGNSSTRDLSAGAASTLLLYNGPTFLSDSKHQIGKLSLEPGRVVTARTVITDSAGAARQGQVLEHRAEHDVGGPLAGLRVAGPRPLHRGQPV